MGGDTQPISGNEIVLERIDNIHNELREIKTEVKTLSECYRVFEKDYIRERAILASRVDAAHTRLDNHSKTIAEIEKKMTEIQSALQPLISTNKLLTWIGGLLGASVIALIWAIVTHQISLVIP